MSQHPSQAFFAQNPAADVSKGLRDFPPPEKWDDWVELDSKSWPKRVEKRYTIVPTTCFNCEAGCGLLAYVDKDSGQIRKFEGNPTHPGSRGRNCAKGPATMNQVNDPERVLYPLKRKGPRGSGEWERVTWDHVLDTFAARIRKALVENRRTEVMYHVGRPGHDGYMDRILKAWGVDGHNSHTNVCSASARVGYAMWQGHDRPSPDFAKAKFILLVSSHLETGHYFNPHAQRIIDGKMAGATLAVIDTRLSNTASMADTWLSTWPGSEAYVLLSIARHLLEVGAIDKEFIARHVNWEESLAALAPGREGDATVDKFVDALRARYAEFTFERAAEESGAPAEKIAEIARGIAAAGKGALATHVWRSAASGNLGGWQVARCLYLLNVLTGSVGTEGGVSPNGWNKFVPKPFSSPPPQDVWSELLFPKEWPLAHHELSFLLPHFLNDGRGKVDAYFTRVYNPVWTNPDGFQWIAMLKDEAKIGLHACLTPVFSETAWFADYVLPMGLGGERHDLMSYETGPARWLAFRQPVLRVAAERAGKKVAFTWQANPGEVWEEDEFWIELSWRIDPDGSLGVRKWFESPYRPGEKITIDEYYRHIFENSVPGLPEAAAKENLAPLAYMRKYGSFEVERDIYRRYEDRPFTTPSGKLEFLSPTLRDWGWPDEAMPKPLESHVSRARVDRAKNEFVLLPTFRLPTLIHTRSGNAKWLYEISNSNPVWIHTSDAKRIGVATGDLLRLTTEIGHFVNRAWVTEGILPGVVACSHHLGRWRLADAIGNDRWSSALVTIEETSPGVMRLRQKKGVEPFASTDPDSRRVTWTETGVHQNLTFPVHPDPVSGMHCWHQKVTVEKARGGDRYGDVVVDTRKSMEVYRAWLAMARPAPGPGGLRRPLWLARPVRPTDAAYRA